MIAIEGRSREEKREEQREQWREWPLEKHMDFYMEQGLSRKEAMKAVAADRGVAKRDIYKELLETGEE